MNRLEIWNKNIVSSDLIYKLNPKNLNNIICVNDVVLKSTINTSINDPKDVIFGLVVLELLTNQKAKVSRTRKSIAAFKVRAGVPVGLSVTLRRERMYDFLDRLLAVSLPRTRDFRGINPKGFDGRGNFNLGIKEHIIFPEIDIDKVNKILGMDITFVTTAHSDEEAKALLDAFGFPFIKK